MTEEKQNDEAIECGGLLRRTREGLGLSLDDIADELHLSKYQIQALEDDDWERLPGMTYARGYVRTYARLLGLDAAELLGDATTQELEIRRSARSTAQEGGVDETPVAPEAPKDGSPPRRWGRVAGVVVVVILAGLAWQMTREGGTVPPIINQVVPTGSETAPQATDNEGHGEPAGTRFAEPGHESGTATAVAAPTDPVEDPASPGAPTGANHVVFQFEAPSWIDVRDADGKRLLYRSFKPGRRIEVQGRPPFRIFLGNARGVRVEYSGEVLTPEPAAGRSFARFMLGDTA